MTKHYPIVFYHFHEFKHDGGIVTQLTRHPLRDDHRELIYTPYILAIHSAVSDITVARNLRQIQLDQLQSEGESL